MLEHGIEIPQPILMKSVLLERTKITSIKKHYITYELASEKGSPGITLTSLPHCLNATEMVWHQMKSNISLLILDQECL